MSFERFSRRMEIRARNVPREVNRIVRKVALAVDQTLVLATPVDTGRARSNWVVSVGSASGGTVEPYAPLPPGQDASKLSESGNAQAALAQGRGAVAESTPGAAIHITNNLPYIERLNDGYSAQAPAMFVQAAIEAAIVAIAGAKLNTGR